ncbi:glycosyltransferase family 2 protein [Kordiimonas aestuarii]|uniref:glycosyltransferase family 2 protein n=1 Tax=Kordiimonas aestuarii TaxID=1005925 RepID=UPI0021CFEA03|nr:glycosyltransferase family 2 protein [Kordiimonas aestuarii]
MRLLYLWIRAALLHPVRSLVAFFWLVCGKRLRARNRFSVLIEDERYRYEKWLQKNARLSEAERKKIIEAVKADKAEGVRFVLLCEVPHGTGDIFLRRTIKSLREQFYEHWTLCLLPVGEDFTLQVADKRVQIVCGVQAMPELNDADYICWLKPGDELSEQALYMFARAVEDSPALVYCDEDQLNIRHVRRHSHFKPGWNYELLLACDYIGGLSALRADLARKHGEPTASWKARYGALLSLGEGFSRDDVRHIPAVLYHRYVRKFIGPNAVRLASHGVNHEEMLRRHGPLARQDADFSVDAFGHIRGRRRVANDGPFVSLIIPTRDMRRLTKNCVSSILRKTEYRNFEILIVNNDSRKPAMLQYLSNIASHKKVRVLDYPGAFNYSAINNFAVSQARGDFIGLINNDTEVITPGWLDELLAQAMRAHIGAVGAKLLYGDQRIQHAGVYTGMGGLAGHGHRMLKANKPGYFFRAHLSQYVSAVTAACLIVAKDKFLEVGGLDEEAFKVAFNDVDFCLKLQAAGYDNIYHPHAVLFHYESKSRGKDIKGEKRARYLREATALKAKWGTDVEVDRYFNINLSTAREDFVL